MFKFENIKKVNEAINLAIDDFDEEQYNDNDIKTGEIKNFSGFAARQSITGNKTMSKKTFIHELMKRLPGINKKVFSDFGFINYKVTGNDKEWPYIINVRGFKIEKYKNIFYEKGWITIDSISAFMDLLLVENDIFPNYLDFYVPNVYKRGNERIKEIGGVEEYKKQFKNHYDDCVKIIRDIANHDEWFKKSSYLTIEQISFSPDGAFYVIIYNRMLNDRNNGGYVNKIEIHSTEKIVGETGIDMDEYKSIGAKQRKFKMLLKKKYIVDKTFPKDLMPFSMCNNAAFIFSKPIIRDFHMPIHTFQKARETLDIFRDNFLLKYVKEIFFISMSYCNSLYVEPNSDKYDLYSKLKYSEYDPYLVLSAKDGSYLLAFYKTMDYSESQKYSFSLTYIIIDNSDYSIMPKDYLDVIQYNYTN